ncbi:hypothetical protein YC2023_064720 [Brassica napus]
MSSMDCLSHFFDWDQPIQLQDCFIPDVDITILETDNFFFQSQPQLQFQQPLFQEEAPLELTDLDYFCDQFLPPQETCLPYPKSEIFNETHDLDSFLPAPKLQKLVNSSYHCNPNFFNYYQELDLAPEPSIFPEFRVPDFPLEFKTHTSDVEIETRVLLGSQAIQEKLSTDEVCLVPCEMVRDLASEESIWRNPMIFREINKLLSTNLAN